MGRGLSPPPLFGERTGILATVADLLPLAGGRSITVRLIVEIPPLVGENKQIWLESLAHARMFKVGFVEKPLVYVTTEEST